MIGDIILLYYTYYILLYYIIHIMILYMHVEAKIFRISCEKNYEYWFKL